MRALAPQRPRSVRRTADTDGGSWKPEPAGDRPQVGCRWERGGQQWRRPPALPGARPPSVATTSPRWVGPRARRRRSRETHAPIWQGRRPPGPEWPARTGDPWDRPARSRAPSVQSAHLPRPGPLDAMATAGPQPPAHHGDEHGREVHREAVPVAFVGKRWGFASTERSLTRRVQDRGARGHKGGRPPARQQDDRSHGHVARHVAAGFRDAWRLPRIVTPAVTATVIATTNQRRVGLAPQTSLLLRASMRVREAATGAGRDRTKSIRTNHSKQMQRRALEAHERADKIRAEPISANHCKRPYVKTSPSTDQGRAHQSRRDHPVTHGCPFATDRDCGGKLATFGRVDQSLLSIRDAGSVGALAFHEQ